MNSDFFENIVVKREPRKLRFALFFSGFFEAHVRIF